MNIGEAIGAVTAAIGFARELTSIDKSISETDIKLKVANLQVSLAEARTALADVQTTISEKDEQIAHLKKSFAIREELIEKAGFKYSQKDGKPVGLPFCPRCDTVDGRIIRTVKTDKSGRPHMCPQCKTDYANVPAYLDPTA